MEIYENKLYQEDLEYISLLDLPWESLQNSSILISGASGLIGSCLIDLIVHCNISRGLNCKIYALGRDKEKAKKRFLYYWDNPLFQFIPFDIINPLRIENIEKVGYVIHLASNTHPVAYAMDPIGTVTTNIIGTYNMLNFAVQYHADRAAIASSNEIYGENRGDVEFFNESYCGYINCNTLRAGYPESKRAGEALCQAFRNQKKMDIVIPRFTRSYGPTMLKSDTKAISQFIKKGVFGEDIVLKSNGNQFYSYTYVADAVAGLLTILLKGVDGEAYNIADTAGDMTLKDLATIIADFVEKKVVFENPDDVESAGYSTATKARLNGEKLKKLGWELRFNIKTGVEHTISILQELEQ